MANPLEVVSSEDSGATDVSLRSTSEEGAPSTSRSCRRRLLLAVAPVLGVAVAAAALLSAAGGVSRPRGAPSERVGLIAGTPGGNVSAPLPVPNPSPQDLNAPKTYAWKTYAPKTDAPELLGDVCPEDMEKRSSLSAAEAAFPEGPKAPGTGVSDGPSAFFFQRPLAPKGVLSRDNFRNWVPGPRTKLGLALKAGLVYRSDFQLEPTSALELKGCRLWSRGEWKFYCSSSDGRRYPPAVVAALRVIKEPWPLEEFKRLYALARPKAKVLRGADFAAHGYTGLVRPARRARSLFDLQFEPKNILNRGSDVKPNMSPNMSKPNNMSPKGFDVNLAVIVHAALSELQQFCSRLNYTFHGQISSHKMEVRVINGRLVTNLTGFADAIVWHLEENNDEKTQLGRLAPPEAVGKHRRLTDKIDTWSAGLAMVEKLAHKYATDSVAGESQNRNRKLFVESCSQLFAVDADRPSCADFRLFYTKTMAFLDKEASGFKRVLEKMIAVDWDQRLTVPRALEELERLISELEKKESRTLLEELEQVISELEKKETAQTCC